MPFRPTQYEHVPYGDEGSCYPDASQSVSGRDMHDLDLHAQSHGDTAFNHQSVSPISRAVVQENHEYIHAQQNSENSSDICQQPIPSQSTNSLDSSIPKAVTSPLSAKERYKTSGLAAFSNWWWWELGSALVSVSCLVAIIITLLVVQDKALSSWHSDISPNALISTLATISKTSLMLAVAACISQLKWQYLEGAPRSLHGIQIFDDASRGPLGALELLMRLSPREVFCHQSGGVGWAFWASVLTILALALDPFAQQILSFPLRTVTDITGSQALITTSQVYDTRVPAGSTNFQQKNVDMAMQGAVQNGLYTLNSPVNFTCTTANCDWSAFYTVGICSSCTNVTERVNTTCSRGGYGGALLCNYTLPSGMNLSSSRWSSSGGSRTTPLQAKAIAGSKGSNQNITDWLARVALVRNDNGVGNYTRPEAFDCSLSWCAKRYSDVKVDQGEIVTPNIRSWRLKSPGRFYNLHGVWLNPFEVADPTDFDGPNGTFTVNANDHVTLSNWLAESFFTTSQQDAVARALYLQPNMSQTFANIATSMTNKIREGLNSTPVHGNSYREETYIHVTWGWLVLPGVVVLMGVVLLAASIVLTRGDKGGLWKNSVVATLFTQMRGWENEELRVGKWSQMGDQARAMRGSLERDGQGGLAFVRT